MRLGKDAEVARSGLCSWRGLAVCLIAACLVVTLASRVFLASSSHTVKAQSRSTGSKIQHRNKDSHEWAAPVEIFFCLRVPAQRVGVGQREKPLLSVQVDECLYKRPPPVS